MKKNPERENAKLRAELKCAEQANALLRSELKVVKAMKEKYAKYAGRCVAQRNNARAKLRKIRARTPATPHEK